MVNKIIFFDDLTEIYQRGLGYFTGNSEQNCGSIQVAFNDVLGKENEEWYLEFYTLKGTKCMDNDILHFIDAEAIEAQISGSVKGIENVFIMMDAFWYESETIRDKIINVLMKQQDNIYFCIYSTVDMGKVDDVKKQLEQCKYSKNTRAFMLDRADSGVLYKECKNIFQRLKLIVNDKKLWEENTDLAKK